MKYIQIDIHTSREGIEPVISSLLEVDITDTVVEDPADIDELLEKKISYQWDYIDDSVLKLKDEEPKVTVFLEYDEDGKNKLEDIQVAIEALKIKAEAGLFGDNIDLGSLEIETEIEDDSRWKDNWKEYFKPSKISESIVVKPTWEEYEKKDGEIVLEIDPGMAFGTGTHETTSLCVRLLEKYMKPGDKVLDVGCGSGILSIAAALLGASEVLGTEIDPVAVKVSGENILLNHVENIAKAQYGDLTQGLDFKANIVVANLMADLVIDLSDDMASHLLPGGTYISSGILNEKVELVTEAMKRLGFKIIEVKEDGMWSAVAATI